MVDNEEKTTLEIWDKLRDVYKEIEPSSEDQYIQTS